jgi:hypothetical protein
MRFISFRGIDLGSLMPSKSIYLFRWNRYPLKFVSIYTAIVFLRGEAV